jgi:serine/threonine protein kinase
MVAGRPPFTERAAVELALRHVSDPPPPLPARTPRALVEIVERALAKDPADRYPSAREMADALAGIDERAEPVAPSRLDPVAKTRVKRISPRRNFNPAERRRYRVLLACVVSIVLAGLVAGAGSTLGVTLSAGPPPVTVPSLDGQSESGAVTSLRQDRLNASATAVPAPGTAPGTVVRQSPAAGAKVPQRSAVALSVAETPRWRPLTSFTGAHSVPFQIRGNRWQMVSSMSYDGTCLLIFFCSGPNVEVINPSTGATVDQFDLAEGNGKTHVFNTGPGLYQINVTPGSDSATWSIAADDHY